MPAYFLRVVSPSARLQQQSAITIFFYLCRASLLRESTCASNSLQQSNKYVSVRKRSPRVHAAHVVDGLRIARDLCEPGGNSRCSHFRSKRESECLKCMPAPRSHTEGSVSRRWKLRCPKLCSVCITHTSTIAGQVVIPCYTQASAPVF